jgi:hypothetical protein
MKNRKLGNWGIWKLGKPEKSNSPVTEYSNKPNEHRRLGNWGIRKLGKPEKPNNPVTEYPNTLIPQYPNTPINQ